MHRTTPSAPALGPLLATLLAATAGCTNGSDGSPDALPDWSAGYAGTNPDDQADTGGIPDDIDPITGFAIRIPNDLPYETRVHEAGDSAAPCEIQLADDYTGFQGIDCIYETPELDLYGNGLEYELTVPEGACDYVVYQHFMYEAWEVGIGPANVSYTETADGNIVDEVNVNGDGTPMCDYDYSATDRSAPNCCLGSYTLTITHESGEVGVPDEVDVIEGNDWGGDASDCYSGAAFLDPELILSDDGWPMAHIVFTDQAAYYQRFEFAALSSRFYTNVNLANYWDPADHAGSMPAGHQGDWAQPYYLIQCYDNAEELIGQIRMQVREWNLMSEFLADGDPDATGADEPSGSPLNDRQDWADATPGDTTWIRFAQ
ncbi:MAG: hypothetical protein D6798_14555 [Deltaproteobacteria bacterium]|nr:MAG: hypothetical protein D6798_14555 [Deltaproteobacteria bacterium]